MSQARTIVVAGGGTGGHVYPVLAVVSELHKLDPTLQFLYIGQHGGIEATIVSQAKLSVPLPFQGISADKLRRYWDIRTFLLPFSIGAGVVQALGILGRVRPLAVLCKGGYVGVPVALAAWLLRIPIVLHETDSVMGLANRIIAPFASKIAVSFPRRQLGRGPMQRKLVYTGNPVRPEFFEPTKQRVADRPHLVITAGSQGSISINTLILELLPELLDRYTVTHVTGMQDFARVKAAVTHRNYHPIAYAERMVDVLRAADLVVARPGGTIFELAALGKPSILIPHPATGSDHQRMNAQILSGNTAAVVLEPDGLTSDLLLETIITLMKDSKQRATLARNIQQFSRKDAALQLARLVAEVVRKP